MKWYIKLLITFIFLFLVSNVIHAQEEKKMKLSTGFGYFDPMGGGAKGNLFYSKLMFKLPTGLYVGGGLGTSLIFEEYDFGVYRGERIYEVHYLYNFYVEKSFVFGKRGNHSILLGTGLVVEEKKYAYPKVFTQFNIDGEKEIVFDYRQSDHKQTEAGSLLEFNYQYFVVENFGIGVRMKAHILVDIGLGGYIISPTISLSL
jgi:hypothetical protein